MTRKSRDFKFLRILNISKIWDDMGDSYPMRRTSMWRREIFAEWRFKWGVKFLRKDVIPDGVWMSRREMSTFL